MGHRHGVRRTGARLLARGPSRSLYLFDPEDRRRRRPWAEMLPAGFTDVEISEDRFRTADGDAEDGVVIIHASQLPGSQHRNRIFDSAASANLHLLLISGGHQEESPVAEHIHRRRTPVRMREVDPGFCRCFSRFWQHLQETGEMRFELLEPERGMLTVLALLCQGYLLAHVKPGTTSVTLPGTGAAASRQATEAMSRLGLGADSTGSASSVARQAQVSDPSWWSPLDLESLRVTLADSDLGSAAAGILVDSLAAGKTIDGSGVLRAYLALEIHLQGNN